MKTTMLAIIESQVGAFGVRLPTGNPNQTAKRPTTGSASLKRLRQYERFSLVAGVRMIYTLLPAIRFHRVAFLIPFEGEFTSYLGESTVRFLQQNKRWA